MTGFWLAMLLLYSCILEGRLEDLLIAEAGRLRYISLCTSRQLQLNASSLQKVSAMAYDAARDRVLLSDSDEDGRSRLLTLRLEDGGRPLPVPLKGSRPGLLEGLVVSANQSALFATDATNGSIVRVPLTGAASEAAAVSVLHLLPDDRPRGLALDETAGLLFWTNWRFGRQSVERSRLDGSERRRLVSADLYLPGGVAAEPAGGELFFSDLAADGRLRVERAAPDGGGRRAVYSGRHPRAAGLQLAGGRLYWTDSAGVWRLPLAGAGAAPAELAAPLAGRPDAVLVLRADEHCTSYTAVVPTAAAAPDTAPPPAACAGFCLAGHCQRDELAGRRCACPPGRAGDRCQHDVCHNFCLRGECTPDGAGRPRCRCPAGLTGDRCQRAEASPAAGSRSADSTLVLGLPAGSLTVLLAALLVLVTLQTGLMAVLAVRLRRARAAAAAATAAAAAPAPKRFVAVAGKRLRPRPAPSPRDIEDCCQMTLCETPCDASTQRRTAERSACDRRLLVDNQRAGCDNPMALADLF